MGGMWSAMGTQDCELPALPPCNQRLPYSLLPEVSQLTLLGSTAVDGFMPQFWSFSSNGSCQTVAAIALCCVSLLVTGFSCNGHQPLRLECCFFPSSPLDYRVWAAIWHLHHYCVSHLGPPRAPDYIFSTHRCSSPQFWIPCAFKYAHFQSLKLWIFQTCLCVKQGIFCGIMVVWLITLKRETTRSSHSAMMLTSLSLSFINQTARWSLHRILQLHIHDATTNRKDNMLINTF